MKLNVAQELKQPGRIGRCHEDVILDRQEYLGRELKFAAPLTATPARNWMSARCSLTTYSSICLLSASAARIVRGFARFAGAI